MKSVKSVVGFRRMVARQNIVREIDLASSGFVYAVSSSSTTGKKVNFSDEQISYFNKIKEMKLKNPVMIGFGISSRESFLTACSYGSGAIVGSSFIETIKSGADEQTISDFVSKFLK